MPGRPLPRAPPKAPLKRVPPKPTKGSAPAKRPAGKQAPIKLGKAGLAEAVILAPQAARPRSVRVKHEDVEIHAAKPKKLAMKEEDFDEFFQAEIDAEVQVEVQWTNDRMVRWRCQCCDTVLRVPRKTSVLHGAYVLEHDDKEGLLVNGERFVPKADTAIELKQPGRIEPKKPLLFLEKGPLEVSQPGRLRLPSTGNIRATPAEVSQPGRLKDPWTGEEIKPTKRSV